ncbi:hypothetical protein NQ317_009885 [Molorchus minor]|uniref:S-formylglutathione hydrolase n=1 Tax=Molorchus minor TaxID=1323400 RepID=A0ABQ9JMZ7_9CUCU|nr:hypothetical protein NQ317_009885 [Molorchus minor]
MGPLFELLIDQGMDDQFLSEKQLLPENLFEACKAVGVPAILKKREGYNHSYFYIASFIGEHIKYHAEALLK